MTVLTSATTWRIHERAEGALLIDGRDYYRAFYAAASRASTSVLLLGWQFDSDVQLVRGRDLPPGVDPRDVELLALLDRLCRERPRLSVRVLAWDHSVLFALERELLQKLYFDAITCARFDFRWDGTVPLGGSHHQKVAIVDGRVAFLGSQDLCQARWDDSAHRERDADRTARGASHPPYHEVQVALVGEAARSMVDLFVDRWYGATGERLRPERLVARGPAPGILELPVTLAMPPARVGLARTIPEVAGRAPAFEVAELYVRVIGAAERLIYVESQYLTSCAVRDALARRMRDGSRPKLELVVVLPHRPERFKEEVTVGVPQSGVLRLLDRVAREHGHALGVYDVVAGAGRGGEALHVYIHAKVMIVDDRWLLVGSANLTNRSMVIDSEIVAAFEASAAEPSVEDAIRRARVRLLLEHTRGGVDPRALVRPSGLVERLDALAATPGARLRRHDLDAEEPGIFARTVHDLTLELLDPWDAS